MRRLIVLPVLLPLVFAAGPVGAATAARNYDCSKAGNANKTACKGKATAASPAKPPVTPAKPTPAAPTKKAAAAPRNYDCSKAGNANKAVCKSAVSTPTIAPAPRVAAAPAPKKAPAAPAAKSAPARATVAVGAATGKCKDGTETRAVNHRGACSSHGGVSSWY